MEHLEGIDLEGKVGARKREAEAYIASLPDGVDDGIQKSLDEAVLDLAGDMAAGAVNHPEEDLDPAHEKAEALASGVNNGPVSILVYHVTEIENLPSIMEEGLIPGWGDDGYGVYVFTCLASAERYADGGGWDGEMRDPVILEIQTAECELQAIDFHPEWPDPEKYLSILMWPADPDDQGVESAWRPHAVKVIPDGPNAEPENGAFQAAHGL